MINHKSGKDALLKSAMLLISILFLNVWGLSQEPIGKFDAHPPDLVNPGIQEDELVRRAYIKLMFFNMAANRNTVSRDKIYNQAADDIKVEISNLHTGSLSEIDHRNYADMITMPAGEVIQLTPHIKTINDSKDEYVGYEAQWKSGVFSMPENMTIKQFIKIGGPDYADVQKYTSYDVLVRFQGKELFYKALAIYHTPPESSLEPRIEIFDLIMGAGGTMTRVLNEKRPPFGAVRRSSINNRNTRNDGRGIRTANSHFEDRQTESMIEHEEMNDATNLLNPDDPGHFEPTGNGSLLGYFRDGSGGNSDLCDRSGICCPAGSYSLADCCVDYRYTWLYDFLPVCSSGGGWGGGGGGGYDGGSGGGGGGSGDQTNGDCSEETYYADPVQFNDSADSGHILGSHSGRSSLQSYCRVSRNCSAVCDTNFLDVDGWDRGTVIGQFFPGGLLSFSHVIPYIEKRTASATGYLNGNNSPPVCSAIVAFDVKNCLLGLFCSSSISIGGNNQGLSVNLNGEAVWVYKHSTTHTCGRL
ncbi:MAG: hypothetical protein IPL01_18945 [Acidobacteria bacterium]|nr:hypothetical protein [Acidobacteriota bacterium]